MTQTLDAARTRVRSAIDDVEAVRWSALEVDGELAAALEQLMGEGASQGLDIFNVTSTVTLDGNGRADLGALAGGMPIKVVNVAQLQGSTRLSVLPSRLREMGRPVTSLAGQTVELTYVPRPVLPTSPGDTITYGSVGVQSAVLDALLCAIAASALKPKEGEVNAGIEKRKGELWASMVNTASNPGGFVPFSSRRTARSRYRWIMVAQALQLIIEG